MARRIIKRKPRLVRTTIHEDMYLVIENFRREYMKLSGKYIDNSIATEVLAKKIGKIRPPNKKITKRRII